MKNTPSNLNVLPRELQMKRLRKVISRELTELQRYTLVAFYFDKKTITQIARERCVCKSTVFRTLQRAEAKLKKFLRY